MSIAAMKQALEFLEVGHFVYPIELRTDLRQARTVLRQAIEQADNVFDCPRCGHCCPQSEWVRLTDDQLLDALNDTHMAAQSHCGYPSPRNLLNMARAIEKVYGIGIKQEEA